MSENERIAQEILEDRRNRIAPEIDPGLLNKIYEIEAKHQFAKDRSVARDLIRQLIDDHARSENSSE